MTTYTKPVFDEVDRAFGLGSSTGGNPVLVAGERRDAARSEAEARHKIRKYGTALNYTAYLTLEPGLFVGPEIDVELEVTVVSDGGEMPRVQVDAVWLDAWKREAMRAHEVGAVDLLASSSRALKALGESIKAQAEADEGFCEGEIEQAGWVYRGLGGNDPDGHWVREEGRG